MGDWWPELGKGEKVEVGEPPDCGMVLHDQASPREMPLMAVRDGGQMGARPLMRTFQSVVSATMGMDEACVDG
jgi:hypothetical protein